MSKYFKYSNNLLNIIWGLIYLTCFINCSVYAKSTYNKTVNANNNIDNIVINTSPLINNIQLQGRILPLDTIDISAATNAKVENIYIQLGQKVTKGQLLLELKSDQLDIDIRNATETLIRAEMDFNKKSTWLNSNDVFQAQQANLKSKLNYQRSKDIYVQNKLLFEQGIISHNELEQSKITYKDAELNLELSDRNLKQTIAQGDQTQIELLKLALENAKAKLEILQNIKNKLTIRSPIDGVILRADHKDKTHKNTNFLSIVAIGQNVASGENLLAIGNLNGFAVNVQANEQIVQEIKLNQKVNVSIPAIKSTNANIIFDGLVTAIDAQPNNPENNSAPPKYNIKIITNYDHNQHNIFLGMTAKIDFKLIEKPATILIPFTSINYNGSNQAMVLKINNNNIEEQIVTLGKSSSDQIEVLKGLKTGDTIKRIA